MKLNPYGKVPVLVDGDGVIYESAIINEYLEEKYPGVPLLPNDPLQRSLARIWIDYCNTRLQAAAGNIAHDHEVEKSKARVRNYLETLNQEMRERESIGFMRAHPQRDYIAGAYSLADITYIPFFCRLERYQTTIGNEFPNVKAWMQRLLDRPVVRATP